MSLFSIFIFVIMQQVVISSTFISESLKPSISFWLNKAGLKSDILFTAYNQVIHQLLDPNSLIIQNANGINVVCIRFEDWYHEQNQSKLEQNLELFVDAMRSVATKSKSFFLLFICPFSIKLSHKAREFKRLESEFQISLVNYSNIHILSTNEILAHFPMDEFQNDFSNLLAHIPYTLDFYNALGTMIARKALAFKYAPYKVIVLDCDNTLWKGICGEVGVIGIEVTQEFQALQKFMIQQREQGMLLCLCSKNSEEDVISVFMQHPDMVLKLDQITAHRINWNVKSENIISLAKELELGLDSFIFIDDNPMECAQVKAALPEVLTLQLPNEEKNISQFLQNIWFFDHLKITEEDRSRAQSYSENFNRLSYKKNVSTLAEFIAGLELQVNLEQLIENDIARASQLTQRTNQFNVTTLRRSEAELLELMRNYDCFIIRVKDRFGDYGIVGLLLYKVIDQVMVIDTFLLSCRVLGRGVEHDVLSQLGKIAIKDSIQFIEFNYIPTKRNTPALKFLQSIPCVQAVENKFVLCVKQAEKVKITPEINYSEAIFSHHNEIKIPSQTTQMVFNNQELIREIINLSDIKKISRAIDVKQMITRESLQLTSEFCSPKNEKERILTTIWEATLHVNGIGTKDNFFHLGGNSLAAVGIVSEIYQKLFIKLNLTDIFNAPTINELLDVVARCSPMRIEEDRWSSLSSYPLSFAQQGMWFLSQLIENKSIYNVPLILKLQGYINITALEHALNHLIARHVVLRTRIKMGGESLIQDILSLNDVRLRIEKISLDEESNPIDSCIERIIRQPFDLSDFPFIRATLLEITHNEHILCLISHHIIMDARSLDILVRALSDSYNAVKNNQCFKDNDIQQDYLDFALWQQEEFQNKKWHKQIVFWKEQLSDASYLELTSDFQRPDKPSYNGCRSYIQLDEEHYLKLQTISKKEQVTLFMLLLGCFELMLYRFTEDKDILIGVPFSNRNARFNESIGLFVNTLALRVKIDPESLFSEFLKTIRKVTLDAYANQDVPFDKVLEALELKRIQNKHPLFSIMFSHREKRTILSPFDDLKAEFLEYSNLTSLFDLTFISEESENSLQLCFEYATDLFKKETMDQMLSYFKCLIVAVAENPDKKISDLLRFNQKQDYALITKWNNTNQKWIENKTIPELFAEQVRESPYNVAIHYKDEKLTYQELDKLSNSLAHILRKEYGLHKEMIVAIGMDSNLNYMISILAILKAGGAYLSLDVAYPNNRLEGMIEDAKPTFLITTQCHYEKFNKLIHPIIVIDSIALKEKILSSSDFPLDNTNHPSDLAYVIYTSGSTGRPKGVLMEHRNVNNLYHLQKKGLRISQSSKILQFASPCFDAFVWEWVSAILSGATLYMIPHHIKRDPEQLIHYCNQYRITHITLPPSMLAAFPDVRLSSLEVIVVCGELASESVLKIWRKKVYLINAYGPTEATVCSSFHHYEGGSPAIIGRPGTNVQYYILDEHMKHTPLGMSGELYIGGNGLARGYLNRDELTKERFISTSMGRLYKTGDIARVGLDGLVTFLGRKDDQIKVRGYRVELGEIEYHIGQNENVRQVTVLLKETQLVAYVALGNHSILSHTEKVSILKLIQNSLKEKLPHYMMPQFVIIDLESFPIQPNGKIDRKKLASEAHAFMQITYSDKSSRDSIEFALLNIWKEKLNSENIGIEDDFFLLGGNSLMAANLVMAIQEQFQLPFQLKEFYSNPTITNITALLKKRMNQFLNTNENDILFSKCVLPIQTKGSLSPLFIVHPSLGLALPYLGMRQYLSHQPIFGLSDPHFGTIKNRFKSIKDMAKFYVSVVQKIQSQGPYIIAGWSSGGVVALEMAKVLQQQNNSVDKVILIDSYPPEYLFNESEETLNKLLQQLKIKPHSKEEALIKSEIAQNVALIKSHDIDSYNVNAHLIKANKTRPELKSNGWDISILPSLSCDNIPCQHTELFDAQYIKKTIELLKIS